MKRIFGKVVPYLVAALSATGCWAPPQMREDATVLKADVSEITIAGDREDGLAVTDTVRISSNRSWSATVEGSADWLEIDREENLNLAEVGVEVPVVIEAEDNMGTESRRGKIKFTTEQTSFVLEVVQLKREARLNIPEVNDFQDISFEKADYLINIKTNMPWTSETQGEGISAVTPSSGEGDTQVTVSLSANESVTLGRTSVLRIKAGDKSLDLAFKQRKTAPFLTPRQTVVQAEEGRLNCLVKFKANCNWTAEIKDVSGFVSPSLAASSGSAADTAVRVKFPPAVCFGDTARLTVRFTPEGAEPVEVLVKQVPVLRIMAVDVATGKLVGEDEWPLSYPTLSAVPTTKIGTSADPFFNVENDLVLLSGYKIRVFSAAGLWRNIGSGINCGGANSYMIAPAIPDHKLVKVYYRSAGSSPRKLDFSIRKMDKVTVVSGGEQVSLSTSPRENTWTLSGTENNTAYCLFNSNSGNYYMGDLIFYYK